jgi:hypothetical protein
MGTTIRKFDDEPILLVTYDGVLDMQIIEEAAPKIAQVLRESPVPIYGIIDLRTSSFVFSEMIRILHHQSRGEPGTLSGEGDRVVLVGSHPLIRIFRKLFRLEEFGGRIIPIFSDMDDALVAVRGRIAAAASTDSSESAQNRA